MTDAPWQLTGSDGKEVVFWHGLPETISGESGSAFNSASLPFQRRSAASAATAEDDGGGSSYYTDSIPLPPLPTPAATSAVPPAPAASSSWASLVAKHPPPSLPSATAGVTADESAVLSHETAAAAGVNSNARAPPKSGPLCVFFLGGSCRFGDDCRYRHAQSAPEAIAYFEARLLAEAKNPGPAPLQALVLPQSDTPTSDADFSRAGDTWLQQQQATQDAVLQEAVAAGVSATMQDAETALIIAERNVSADVECGICLEQITAVAGRRFGLLSSCPHAFCLDCIRQWRARLEVPKETARGCPVCRTLSYVVVPCERYVAHPGRKAAVSAQHAQQAIPCRNWALGKGTCAFGSSCFYLHLQADGMTPAVLPKHTLRLDSEGNVGVSRAFKLNEFLR